MSVFIIKPEKLLDFGASTTVLLICLFVYLRNYEHFWLIAGIIYLTFFFVSYASVQYTRKPFPSNYEARLRVHASENIEWIVRGVYGETVYEGTGSKTKSLPKVATYQSRNRKKIVAEFVYFLEVDAPNVSVLASLTVETDDEISETVGIKGGDEPTMLYASIPISYGTRHWLIPPFLQGYPKTNRPELS
jgi:hypothetical protein